MKLLYNTSYARLSGKIGTLTNGMITNGINVMPEVQITVAYDHFSDVASGKTIVMLATKIDKDKIQREKILALINK